MISTKERFRRLTIRLKQVFSLEKQWCKKLPKLPNFWYDPFEVYLYVHIKRAYLILTYDEFYFIDDIMTNVVNKISKENDWTLTDNWNYYAGDIAMSTLPNGDIVVSRKYDKPLIISETLDNS